MTDYRTIKSLADDDRPREKLLAKGAVALSDAELLAILIRSGTKRQSAVDLSRQILRSASHSLVQLSRMNVQELMKFHGVGEAKALSIIAALELGRRRRSAEVPAMKRISSSRDVFELLAADLSDNVYEEFWVLLLNRANNIITKLPVSEGGISGTVADPRRIFKAALLHNAVAIILCHNHPSGNIKPSDADIALTRKMKEAGAMLDISVLDHLIVSESRYFSFADEGLL